MTDRDRIPTGLFATPEQTFTPPTDDTDQETPEEADLRELRANLFPTRPSKENDDA